MQLPQRSLCHRQIRKPHTQQRKRDDNDINYEVRPATAKQQRFYKSRNITQENTLPQKGNCLHLHDNVR